jgi:hypothetical protein
MKKEFKEGISETSTPDMKYYAFDWDDNIMMMPTKIILKDDNGMDVEMSTEDFATYRTKIGKEPFEYDGQTVVDFSKEPFINFGVKGDKKFLIDSMTAEPGPAWSDFKEAINGGSVFAIITARGHTPSIMKEACYNLIISNHNGLDSTELTKNLEKYRNLADEDILPKNEMIREYLNLCRFYPVSYGEGSATNPEQGKIKALREFIEYIKELGSELHKKAFLKNKVSNKFNPLVGFSDDDLRNLEKIKGHFGKTPELKMYSTHGGIKKPY